MIGEHESGRSPGRELLRSRNRAIPDLLRSVLVAELPGEEIRRGIGPGGVVTTGVGSSAAHARFLASVLVELGTSARFVPLSCFLETPPAAASAQTLVVFSQGLAPNARLALGQAPHWHSVWLATATGRKVAGYEAPPGDDEKARRDALDAAIASGVQILPYAGVGEYGTLLRLVGPMTGYAAALRFAALASGRRVPWLAGERWTEQTIDGICSAVANAVSTLEQWTRDIAARDLEANLILLAGGTHSERVENIRLKFVEGALRPMPPVCDLLELAHGPLQQALGGPATLIALARQDSSSERDLLERLSSVLEPGRHKLLRLTSRLPGALAIFEHEALVNELVLRVVDERALDPCQWPGKGADAALYSLDGTARTSLAQRDRPAAPAVPRRRTAESIEATRRLELLTWPDLDELLASGERTAILPLGSIEQHGPHLPFATDAWIARELCRRLCSRLPEAVELPVVSFGCASEHLGFPGTLSLEETTLASLLADLTASIARHGFARLFVFSAHGGNRQALETALPHLRARAGSMAVAVAPGLGATMELLHGASARHAVPPEASGQHAGEFETSILLGLGPGCVRRDRFAPGLVAVRDAPGDLFYPDLRANAPNGTVGDPSLADGSRAEMYLETWVDSLLAIYRSDESWKDT